MRRSFLLLFCVAFAISTLCTGCVVLAPIIETYRGLGISSSDRMALLDERVKVFHDAIYWGRSQHIVQYADKSVRAELLERARASRQNVKLIESKIDFVEFNDDIDEATVDVLVKFYKIPFYVVNERLERQTWKFVL
jgi:hypothetical protein